MADYGTVTAGLAHVLSQSANLSVVYEHDVDTIITPSLIIVPGSPVVEYAQTFKNGLTLMRFRLIVCLQRFETTSAMNRVNAFLYGPDSIFQLVEADPTLNGTVSTSQVVNCTNVGMVARADTDYLGAEFELEAWL